MFLPSHRPTRWMRSRPAPRLQRIHHFPKVYGGYDVSRYRSLSIELKACSTRVENLMKRIAAECRANDPELLETLADDWARMESGDVTLIELAEIFARSDEL